MKEINIQQAEQELVKRVLDLSIEDAVYELAFDQVSKVIDSIEEEFYVVDEDGLPCMSDSGCSEMWFDEMRDEMMQEVDEKVRRFLSNQ